MKWIVKIASVTACVILLVWATILALGDWATGFSRWQHIKFRFVRHGMNETSVIRLLGMPYCRTNTFFIGQRHGYENIYEAADRSGSSFYLSWINGIDYVYTVGFSQRSNAVFKAEGGT